MPKILITPEALVRGDGPHIDLLKEAGFDAGFPEDATFIRELSRCVMMRRTLHPKIRSRSNLRELLAP